MYYRRLGRTERQVSILGVGGGYIMLREIEEGTRIYQRAAELGINYFDGRYGFTGVMQRPVIAQDREHFIVATKTASHTYEGAKQRIDEDLAELGTDYLDIFYLRTYNFDMLDAHFAPGGSLEALLEARRQGKIRAIGLAGHGDINSLVKGVESGLVDVVMFPLNIVHRQAFKRLIPACQAQDVGMTIMKPVNVGIAPAEICLPWLANQPIHVMVPGMSTMEHLEADVAMLDRDPLALTPEEEAEVERCRMQVNADSCQICDNVCQAVCEPKLNIDWLIYHNVFQNELRRLGVDGFLKYPFAPWVKEQATTTFTNTLNVLNTCTACGKCEEACPYGVGVIDLIERIKKQEATLLEAIQREEWETQYEGAQAPMSKKIMKAWIEGGKKKGRT